MAIWQYDVYLLPRAELEAKFGSVPRRVTVAEFEEAGFWSTRQPAADAADRF